MSQVWKLITVVFLISFTSFCRMIEPTEYLLSRVQRTQNLAISGCTNEHDDFCAQKVDNSICNHDKNECFCKRGFVAIREEANMVACKTLLTDLTCRVDSDCVHVNRSSCHPGAGFCNCPSGTIYVPLLHACRDHASLNQQICNVCHSIRGECFKYNMEDPQPWNEQMVLNSNSIKLGCVCKDNETMSESLLPYRRSSISRGNEPQNVNFCGPKMVDVGDYCDDFRTVCRSKNAKCQPFDQKLNTANSSLVISASGKSDPTAVIEGRCICAHNHVPIFQANLRYHECFPALSHLSQECKKCSEENGKCYDINKDEHGDGCKCPAENSHQSNDKVTQLQKPCGVKHLNVECSNGYLRVCYNPHFAEPYEDLEERLKQGSAVVKLATAFSFSKQSPIDTCDLVVLRTLTQPSSEMPHMLSNNQTRFCIEIDTLNPSPEHQCGIRSYNLSNGDIEYDGELEVLMIKDFRTPSRDISLPFKCVTKKPTRKSIQIKTSELDEKTEVKIPSEKRFSKTAENISLWLRIVNEFNNEVTSVLIGEKIKLDILLLDSSNEFQEISVEKCVSSATKASEIIHIMNNCPFGSKGLTMRKLDRISNTEGSTIHLQSENFAAFRLNDFQLVSFHCDIRLCSFTHPCHTFKCPDKFATASPLINPVLKDENSFRTMSAVIEVTGSDVNLGSVNLDENAAHPCPYAVCLNSQQIIVMTLLILLLFLLIFLLLVCVYQKNKSSFSALHPTHSQPRRNVPVDNSFYTQISPSSNVTHNSSVYQDHIDSNSLFPTPRFLVNKDNFNKLAKTSFYTLQPNSTVNPLDYSKSNYATINQCQQRIYSPQLTPSVIWTPSISNNFYQTLKRGNKPSEIDLFHSTKVSPVKSSRLLSGNNEDEWEQSSVEKIGTMYIPNQNSNRSPSDEESNNHMSSGDSGQTGHTDTNDHDNNSGILLLKTPTLKVRSQSFTKQPQETRRKSLISDDSLLMNEGCLHRCIPTQIDENIYPERLDQQYVYYPVDESRIAYPMSAFSIGTISRGPHKTKTSPDSEDSGNDVGIKRSNTDINGHLDYLHEIF